MAEPLPDEFDVLVLGTGLPESMSAAACARAGMRVLHIDRNDYYGGAWASFNLSSLCRWAGGDTAAQGSNAGGDGAEPPDDVRAGERFVGAKPPAQTGAWVDYKWLCDSATRDQLLGQSRKFSIDLLPKVLLSRGELVDTLIRSGVGRYAEFKTISQYLCLDDEGALCQVPCSRSDLFASQSVPMVEKRRLMKFMQFCVNHEQRAELWQEYADRPFDDFLASGRVELSARSRAFVRLALTGLPRCATTRQSLLKCDAFIRSVGRFGNSPHLAALYGSGELPQCFCRLCAVHGGVYCLRTDVQGYYCATDEGGELRVAAVRIDGRRVGIGRVFADSAYVLANEQFGQCARGEPPAGVLQRAIYVTDRSMRAGDEKEKLTMLNIEEADAAADEALVSLLEVGAECCVAPKGYFVVHASSHGGESAASRLERVVRAARLFDFDHRSSVGAETADEAGSSSGAGGAEHQSDGGDCGRRPSVLFQLYFDVPLHGGPASGLPANVHCVPQPSTAVDDVDALAAQVRELFARAYPDADYLPEPAVDPELENRAHEEEEDQSNVRPVTGGDNGFPAVNE